MSSDHADQVATKQDVEDMAIQLRGEMADLRGELLLEMGRLRGDFGDLRGEFEALRRQLSVMVLGGLVTIWLTVIVPQAPLTGCPSR